MKNKYSLNTGTSVTIVSNNSRSTVPFELVDSNISIVELGLTVNPNKHFSQAQADKKQAQLFRNLKKNCRALTNLGITINSCHMPFGCHFDITELDYTKLDKTIKKLSKIMKKAEKYANPKYFVFHPGSPEWTYGSISKGEHIPESERGARYSALIYSLSQLARATNTPICIENMPGNLLACTAEEQCKIIDTVNSVNKKQGFITPPVGAVVDVNHITHESPKDAILTVGERLMGVHISDCKKGHSDQHLLPGKGDLNFTEIIGALNQVGFSGVFMYEAKDTGRLSYLPWNQGQLFSEYERSLEPPIPTEMPKFELSDFSHIDTNTQTTDFEE